MEDRTDRKIETLEGRLTTAMKELENRVAAKIDKVDTKADEHFRRLMEELNKVRYSDAEMLKRNSGMFFSRMAQVLVLLSRAEKPPVEQTMELSVDQK
jgi:hypothetical protein